MDADETIETAEADYEFDEFGEATVRLALLQSDWTAQGVLGATAAEREEWLAANSATLREIMGVLWRARCRLWTAAAPGTPLHTLNGHHAFQGDTWRLVAPAVPGSSVALYIGERTGDVFGVLEQPLLATRLL
jgi:hypothetical protein